MHSSLDKSLGREDICLSLYLLAFQLFFVLILSQKTKPDDHECSKNKIN